MISAHISNHHPKSIHIISPTCHLTHTSHHRIRSPRHQHPTPFHHISKLNHSFPIKIKKLNKIQSILNPTTNPLPDIDLTKEVLECPTLREHLVPRPSPFVSHLNYGGRFVNDKDRVALNSIQFASLDSTGAGCHGVLYSEKMSDGSCAESCLQLPDWAVRAGARETIYYNPELVRAAIVTCGGLCPGLNDVVQGLVGKLEDYGVPEGQIHGIR